MNYRDLWIAVYLAKANAGISADKSAAIADGAVKELKSRDDNPESGWNVVRPTA